MSLNIGKCVRAEAYSMLGFTKRICKDFRNIKALESIFFAHIRSHLDYASVVHITKYITIVLSLSEKVFNVRFEANSIMKDTHYHLPPYVSRLESIGMKTLSRQ